MSSVGSESGFTPDSTLSLDDDGLFLITLHRFNTGRFDFRINLGNEGIILITVHNEFVNVQFEYITAEDFESCVGMMGRFPDGAGFDRNCQTLIKDPSSLGQEWQVQMGEPKLFHSVSGPQAPDLCGSASDDGDVS
jgi:hypothetical protein